MIVMTLKIAVTGASGFVGRNTIAHLLKEDFEVTAVASPEDEKLFYATNSKFTNISSKFTNIAVESTEVVESLTEILAGNDAVIHLVYVSEPDLSSFERNNTVANQNVINAAMRAGIKKFITNSGLGVVHLGRKRDTTNGYFRMKKRLEDDLVKAWWTAGMHYVIFRPSYIIGKGDELTPMIAQKIRNGETISIVGNGRYRMQPISIRDVVQIYSTCIKWDDFDNQIIDLVGPEKISYIDYVKLVGKIIQREPFVKCLTKQDAINRKAEFGLNEDEINVLMCDEVGDERLLQKTFALQPTPLEEAIEMALEKS